MLTEDHNPSPEFPTATFFFSIRSDWRNPADIAHTILTPDQIDERLPTVLNRSNFFRGIWDASPFGHFTASVTVIELSYSRRIR